MNRILGSRGSRWCLAVLLLFPGAAARGVVEEGRPADPLEGLRPGHPRILLTEARLAALKERASSDALLAKCVQDVIDRADRYLRAAPPRYEKRGPRLLHVSREVLSRTYALGLAWRWTGEERYAKKEEETLSAACAFPDWNPSHFLDTAEMSHAAGVGYDWLYGFLSPAGREKIRTALVEKGLKEGLRAYGGKGAWWVHSTFNWNQVCNSGLLVGALALADEEPETARTILSAAIHSLPRALATYDPDGAWPEGPGYWHYATSYTAFGLAALESALGRDFGLAGRQGLARAARFPLYAAGPAGLLFNYADCGERSRRGPLPELFWLGARYEDPWAVAEERRLLRLERASPLHVVWYAGPEEAPSPDPPLDRCFRGPVETAFFRSAWHDPEALFLAVKAGYNRVNHGHLDLGTFVLDALGIRWFPDLGADDYNLPGYWQAGRGGKRWSYFRLNSLSHNVPLLDGEGQDPGGAARMVRFHAGREGPFAILDLGSAYASRAEKVLRGAALTAGRRGVLVQDEYVLKQPCTVCFGLTTDARVEKIRDRTVLLSKQGRRLRLQVLSPEGARVSVKTAERPPPERRNKGVRRVEITFSSPGGACTCAVFFAPEWKEGPAPEIPVLRPLDRW